MTQTKTTESQLENALIETLKGLKYRYREDIKSRYQLEANFRSHFEKLNEVTLSNDEWERLKGHILGHGTFASAKLLRERHTFHRDDDSVLYYSLVNTQQWCKNEFEVINQLRMNTENSFQRYDVILLMNGIPVVQIELKGHTISPKKALEQIVAYKNERGNGYKDTLLAFIQLFVVSNEAKTFYFTNNDSNHFAFQADERYLPIYTFADSKNKQIVNLHDFAEAFLPKCTLAEMISRYMVLLETEQKLIMMRPYQIYAVKNIMKRVEENSGNGYIWHTTGSGKTLTSFKASTLMRDNPNIEKCIFVVDRKDLDRQTRDEFNRFQEGCVEQNHNTAQLVDRLTSEDVADKVIVTTIQKLGRALSETRHAAKLAPLARKRVVFIFDECHRSQFGDNHTAIRQFFPRAQLFGFTGTPIFPENARTIQITGNKASYKTTADIFEQQLHAYTITHAINDENVLKFKIDYYGAEKVKRAVLQDKNQAQSLYDIPSNAPDKEEVVRTILSKHDTVTADRKFNAIFATASIDDAIEYYKLFKSLQAEHEAAHDPHSPLPFRPLNIACVFSPPPSLNSQIAEDCAQETEDYKTDPDGKRQSLEIIIADYNKQFGTNHTISEFDTYYQDVQGRIKSQKNPRLTADKKLDLVIVVDMLLTGFDSPFLNTLYIDKKLAYHGLIQAMSRTNRILNNTKPYGHIFDFRGQQKAVDKAITLFSGEGAEKAAEIWLVEDAATTLARFQRAVQKTVAFMDSCDLKFKPEDVNKLKGDAEKFKFIDLYKDVQTLANQLAQHTDLTPKQQATITEILPNPEGFKGAYLETVRHLKQRKNEPHPENAPDPEFELVLFASAIIDYDYIMTLLAHASTHANPERQRQTREEVLVQLAGDSKFMDDYEYFAAYIRSLPLGTPLTVESIRHGFERYCFQQNATELTSLAASHALDPDALQTFVSKVLHNHLFDMAELYTDLIDPLDLSWKGANTKASQVMGDLYFILKRLAKGKTIEGLEDYHAQ